MTAYDALIERLTHRLRVDPELRADVAGELRTHLDDAAAEYRRGGYSDEDAAAEAVRALGDEADLARQLWQANRRRIALRRVCKWAARVALVPGAIAVIALVTWGARSSRMGRLSPTAGLSADFLGAETLQQMTGEQALIVLGDAEADTYVASQRAIVERWPDDPVYRANYIGAYLAARRPHLPTWTPEGLAPAGDPMPPQWSRRRLDRVETEDPEALLENTLAELDRAAAADPDNAFYPAARAALRIQAAACDPYYDAPEDERDDKPPYVHIGDEIRFARALNDLRLAAAKPYWSTHQAELIRRRLEAMPPNHRLMDLFALSGVSIVQTSNTWFPSAVPKDMAKAALSYALQLAAEGRGDEALQLNRRIRLLAAKCGAGSQTVVECLSATGMYAVALRNEADIREALGQTERAQALRDRNEDFFALHKTFFPRKLEDGGATRRLTWYHKMSRASYADPAPMRAAQYALGEQLVLIYLLVVVLVLALLAAAATGVGFLRRKTGRRLLLFVGWRRIGWICLAAIAAPLAGYVLYTRLAPVSPHRFGAWYALGRLAVEAAVLVVVLLGLLTGLTYGAIRRRAAEAGLDVPPPRRLRDRRVFVALASLLGIAAVAYIVVWEIANAAPDANAPFTWVGAALAGVIGAAFLAWLVREVVFVLRLRAALSPFRKTLFRSSIGVFAASIILIGTLSGLALRRAEAMGVTRMSGRAGIGLASEMEISPVRDLRAWFAEEHATLMAEGIEGDVTDDH
ncbi:MAG: permease prefix domain 1-containing protein [Planctomycetota bacterium]